MLTIKTTRKYEQVVESAYLRGLSEREAELTRLKETIRDMQEVNADLEKAYETLEKTLTNSKKQYEELYDRTSLYRSDIIRNLPTVITISTMRGRGKKQNNWKVSANGNTVKSFAEFHEAVQYVATKFPKFKKYLESL